MFLQHVLTLTVWGKTTLRLLYNVRPGCLWVYTEQSNSKNCDLCDVLSLNVALKLQQVETRKKAQTKLRIKAQPRKKCIKILFRDWNKQFRSIFSRQGLSESALILCNTQKVHRRTRYNYCRSALILCASCVKKRNFEHKCLRIKCQNKTCFSAIFRRSSCQDVIIWKSWEKLGESSNSKVC